jgi:hypothetical protein
MFFFLQFLALYIRFEHADSICLGTEGHICELQLALNSFVNLQVLHDCMHIDHIDECANCSCWQNIHTHARYHSFRAIQTRTSRLHIDSTYGMAIVYNNRICADPESLNDTLPVKIEDKSIFRTDSLKSIEEGLEHGNCDCAVDPGSKGNCSHCFRSLEFPSDKIRVGIEIFQRSALLSGSMLDEAVANVFKAVNLSSSSSVLFTRYSD